MRAASLLVMLCLGPSCGGRPNAPTTPTPPTGSVPPACANYSGTWTARHVDQCGVLSTATVTLTQSDCQLRVTLPEIGDFTMNVGGAPRQVQVAKDAACQNIQLPGTVDELGDTIVHVIYGSGPDGCCRHGGLTLRR